jgi:hypothetical protein
LLGAYGMGQGPVFDSELNLVLINGYMLKPSRDCANIESPVVRAAHGIIINYFFAAHINHNENPMRIVYIDWEKDAFHQEYGQLSRPPYYILDGECVVDVQELLHEEGVEEMRRAHSVDSATQGVVTCL